MVVAVVVAFFAVAGCHDEDTEYVVIDNTRSCVSVDERNPIWLYNTQFYGQTTRWADGNIRVRFPNAGVGELQKLQQLIDEINPLIAPACQLVIVPWVWNDYQSAITIEWPSFVGEFGSGTTERFPISNYTINKAVIHLAHSISLQGNVLKRELIHALGFSGYTHDGGVMDAAISSDIVTPTVHDFLIGLYALPPGSYVGP